MHRAIFLLLSLLPFAVGFSDCLMDLEELGYCVILNVLPQEEAKELYDRVWLEYIEKAWPNCKRDDPSNWKETFPMHNKMCIFAGPAGQTQAMWHIRQDPRIVEPFARVWGTHDLIVSMDGLSFMCPVEIRECDMEPWPHVDQAVMRHREETPHSNKPPLDFVSESPLHTKPYTIQGQFLFEDSYEGDGGFYCIPRSHLRFAEFAPKLEALDTAGLPDRRKAQYAYLRNFFSNDEIKHVTAPKGSLILWDSRTVHWNQHPEKGRPIPKVRMVGYLCYVPKSRLTDLGKELRKKAFENGISTGHNPAYPELKPTLLRAEFAKYYEDPGYIQPTIHLTPLGLSLLNLSK